MKFTERDYNLLREIFRTKGLQKGNFELTSGKKSDYYIDTKPVTLNPLGASLICNAILKKINNYDFNCIGGRAVGAIPILGALSISCFNFPVIRRENIKLFFDRGTDKTHGTEKRIEGDVNFRNNKFNIMLIDDVITTGKSIVDTICYLNIFDQNIIKVISIVNRATPEAINYFNDKGIIYDYVLDIKDIINENI